MKMGSSSFLIVFHQFNVQNIYHVMLISMHGDLNNSGGEIRNTFIILFLIFFAK